MKKILSSQDIKEGSYWEAGQHQVFSFHHRSFLFISSTPISVLLLKRLVVLLMCSALRAMQNAGVGEEEMN